VKITCLPIATRHEERPECIPCNSNFSLKHVLIDCVDVADVRQTFYNANSLSKRLPVPSDFDRKNKESCQLGHAFRVICYEFAGPSYLANVLKYISL
jgi:hypothetical protein